MDCRICLEDFTDINKSGHSLPCGHKFHTECIVKWLRHNPACPLCKDLDGAPERKDEVSHNLTVISLSDNDIDDDIMSVIFNIYSDDYDPERYDQSKAEIRKLRRNNSQIKNNINSLKELAKKYKQINKILLSKKTEQIKKIKDELKKDKNIMQLKKELANIKRNITNKKKKVMCQLHHQNDIDSHDSKRFICEIAPVHKNDSKLELKI